MTMTLLFKLIISAGFVILALDARKLARYRKIKLNWDTYGVVYSSSYKPKKFTEKDLGSSQVKMIVMSEKGKNEEIIGTATRHMNHKDHTIWIILDNRGRGLEQTTDFRKKIGVWIISKNGPYLYLYDASNEKSAMDYFKDNGILGVIGNIMK